MFLTPQVGTGERLCVHCTHIQSADGTLNMLTHYVLAPYERYEVTTSVVDRPTSFAHY